MRKKLILFFLILPFLNKAQTFSWAKAGNGAGGFCEGMAVATDTNSNVFITGEFTSPNIIFGTYTLTNAGVNGDAYLVKYDQNGNIQWVNTIGGIYDDVGTSVATDASGNVFVTGYFTSPSMTIGTYSLTNSGTNDIFLVKFDASGNVVWAQSVGDTGSEMANGVSSDAAGNSFITGSFTSPTLAIGSTTLTNAGGNDMIYIAKFNASGAPQWALSAGGVSDYGLATATDNSGNVYVSGSFSNPTLTFGTTTITSTGFGSAFIGKFDTNGNSLWAKASSGSSYADGYSVSADPSGNVYLAGDFTGPKAVFGAFTVTNPGGGTMFVTKYDNAGNVLWARGAGGGGGHIGYSVSSYTGGIYVTGGVTAPTSVFGAYTLSTPTASTDPMFIVRYDPNGNVICADVLPTGGDDQSAVSVDKFGNAFITGDFIFSPFVLGPTSLTRTGTEDIFVTRYTCSYNLGVEVLDKEESSLIYPNPNNGTFNLMIRNELENAEIILFNALGQKIHEQKIEQGINSIDVNSSKGIYNYIILQDKQKLNSGTIVVE